MADTPKRKMSAGSVWMSPLSAFSRYQPGINPPLEEPTPDDWEMGPALVEALRQDPTPCGRRDRLH